MHLVKFGGRNIVIIIDYTYVVHHSNVDLTCY